MIQPLSKGVRKKPTDITSNPDMIGEIGLKETPLPLDAHRAQKNSAVLRWPAAS
jgi:hypothetical protein